MSSKKLVRQASGQKTVSSLNVATPLSGHGTILWSLLTNEVKIAPGHQGCSYLLPRKC